MYVCSSVRLFHTSYLMLIYRKADTCTLNCKIEFTKMSQNYVYNENVTKCNENVTKCYENVMKMLQNIMF